jgi:hypothetical protein
MLIDFKYSTCNPSIFTCPKNGAFNFWQGVMWAANVAKMGYRWHVGKGNRVHFWKDVWIGTSSLAIQYWELYYIVNEQNSIVADLWDGRILDALFVGVWMIDFTGCGRNWLV